MGTEASKWSSLLIDNRELNTDCTNIRYIQEKSEELVKFGSDSFMFPYLIKYTQQEFRDGLSI
jgi:hypothetical protein